jgi:hypothetical protein
MHDRGLYSIEDMRPINELRMKARWKLGAALAAVERIHGARPKLSSPRENFAKFLKTIGLDNTLGMKAQRIGAMPNDELAKAFDEARKAERLLHYGELIVRARPWWFQESRVANLFGHPAKLLALRKWCDANHGSRAKSHHCRRRPQGNERRSKISPENFQKKYFEDGVR